MLNDKAVRGSNFTCVHAGPMEGWAQFRLEPPDVPLPARGKLFLRNLLGSAGLEMSLNVVPPGKGMPFLHKHQQNEEVYVVVGCRGQFLVDGECIDVAEGSVVRISPPAARAWRNKTTISPVDLESASALVTSGVFRFSRNPMYVGFTAMLVGWAVCLAAPWALVGPVAFVLFTNRFQIIPEERVMRDKFGQAYDDYQAQVRRWI